MVRIKIVSGVFGWKHGAAYDLVRAGDPAIEVEEKLAHRLVKQKVAQYVEAPAEEGNMPDLPDGVYPVPAFSIDNTVAELREIAKQCGVTFKVGMTKEDMVAALEAHIEANMVDGVDLDENETDGEPEGEPQDEPEDDAPTFDAAEAVQ